MDSNNGQVTSADQEKIISQRSGRAVIDTPKNQAWRDAYYRKVDAQHGEDWFQMTGQIYREKIKALNILNTTQVAEYFRVSHATAWKYMREGIIPSFKHGRCYYTHAYVIDEIERKARTLFDEGYARRSYPRLVFKYEKGLKW